MLSSWGSSSVRKSCCACTHPIPQGPAKSSLVPRKGRRALDQTLTLPAPLPCYIPTWTKAERSIQYNTYIFHYEIAISFPAFYFMHPELYAAFYITPEGWWGWVVSHARQLLSLEVTHRTHQQLWMEWEQQLNPSAFWVWMGMSKPEAREVAGTVQHAHGVVTPRARGCGTARPTSPQGELGLQPQGEVLPKVSPCGTRSPIQGLGHRSRAVITGTSAELGVTRKEEQSCASCAPSLRHIVRLYSMPLLAEMPDQGRRLQRRLWACLYILWGMEHGLRLASVEPMCCR